MNFTTHRAKDSVPGGGAAGASSASPIANKPTAIPQSMLDKLKDVPEPVRKPVDPDVAKERMPPSELGQLLSGLRGENPTKGVNVLVDEIIKNRETLHKDDIREICMLAIASPSINAMLMALDLAKDLPNEERRQIMMFKHSKGWISLEVEIATTELISTFPSEWQPDLIELVFKRYNDQKVLHVAFNHISKLDKKHWPNLLEKAIRHCGYDIIEGALELSAQLPDGEGEKLKAIVESLIIGSFNGHRNQSFGFDSGRELDVAMLLPFESQLEILAVASKQIRDVPGFSRCVDIILQLSSELRSKPLAAALENTHAGKNRIQAVRIIPTLKKEDQTELIKAALKLEDEAIRELALRLALLLPPQLAKEIYNFAMNNLECSSIRDHAERVLGCFKDPKSETDNGESQ